MLDFFNANSLCSISHAKHANMYLKETVEKNTLTWHHKLVTPNGWAVQNYVLLSIGGGDGGYTLHHIVHKEVWMWCKNFLFTNNNNYIYINFFFIQNLRVNWCCLENRRVHCRYSKCSFKAWKLWILKDTCSCQSYDVIDQFFLFCKQIKFFWLSVISLVVHLAVCCQGVLFWILRWNEHGLLDNLVFYLKGTI